jgi:hypothetical protein
LSRSRKSAKTRPKNNGLIPKNELIKEILAWLMITSVRADDIEASMALLGDSAFQLQNLKDGVLTMKAAPENG